MPALEVPADRRALARHLLGSLAFVAAGVWLVVTGPVVAGVLALVVFGPVAAWLAAALLRRGPALVVDARGVTDRSSPAAAGLVPWSQVTWVADGGASVQLGLRDPPARPLARLVVRANAFGGGPVVRIPVALLGTTAAELSRAIAARAPE